MDVKSNMNVNVRLSEEEAYTWSIGGREVRIDYIHDRGSLAINELADSQWAIRGRIIREDGSLSALHKEEVVTFGELPDPIQVAIQTHVEESVTG